MTSLAIVLTGAIGRALGPAEFGVWYLLSTIAAFGSVFVDWGYGPYIIREISQHPERAGELTGTVLLIRTATLLAICVPAILATALLGYPARIQWLAGLILLCWLPILLANAYTWSFRGRERMDFEATVNVALKASSVALTLCFLISGTRLVGVMVAQALGGVVALAYAMWVYRRLQLTPLRVSLNAARELLWGAAPIFSMSLAVALQPYIDANLLSKLVPAHVMGWYGAAAAFCGTLLAPAIIVGSTFYPRLSRTTGNPAAFNRLVMDGLRPILILSMLAAVGTYLFADVAVSLVYHKAGFAEAASILRAFAPGLFLASVDIFLGSVLMALGKMGVFAKAKILAVITTVGLELLLIPYCQARLHNGAVGVTLSFTAGELLMVVAALRLIPRGLVNRGTVIDLGHACLAGAAAVALIYVIGPVSAFIAIPAAIAMYTVTAMTLGLIRRSDFEQLASVLARRTFPVPPAIEYAAPKV